MAKVLIVVEQGQDGYGAYVPDVDGVFATGKTLEEVRQRIQEALAAHLGWLHTSGDPLPTFTCTADYVNADMSLVEVSN